MFGCKFSTENIHFTDYIKCRADLFCRGDIELFETELTPQDMTLFSYLFSNHHVERIHQNSLRQFISFTK